VKITQIEHIYDPTADFRRSKIITLMHLQRYIILVTAISRQLRRILSYLF